jgi:hypothetical protein
VEDAHGGCVVLARFHRSQRNEPQRLPCGTRRAPRNRFEAEDITDFGTVQRDGCVGGNKRGDLGPGLLGIGQEVAQPHHGALEWPSHVNARLAAQILRPGDEKGIVNVMDDTLARQKEERRGRKARKDEACARVKNY